MLILLTLYKLCAVRSRHIICITEDVQHKQVNHQVLAQGGGTTQKYFPMNESLLLPVDQVKWLVAYGRPQKSIYYEYHSKLLVFKVRPT